MQYSLDDHHWRQCFEAIIFIFYFSSVWSWILIIIVIKEQI